jgi:hydrogenase-4 component F
MGIVAIGIGIGGAIGIFAALLHAFNHSIAKSLLFFGAGNVRENYGTLRIERIRGMAKSLPWTSGAVIVGGLAIVGLPPFGLFVSEFMILTQAFATAHYFVAVLLLVVLSVVFGALLYHFQHMLGGEVEQAPQKPRLLVSDFAAMSACAMCLLVLGVRIPAGLNAVLNGALAVLR